MRSSRLAFLLAVMVVFGGSSSVVAQAGTIVERTLAFINKKPILFSEVQLTKALLQLDDAQALEKTIDERLMFEEAARLLSTPLAEKDVEGAVAALREKVGDSVSEVALVRKAQAQLTIAAYIDLRLRPLLQVDDADVRRLFDEKARNDPKAPQFDEVEVSIRESLERRSLDRRIEEWVRSLRERAEIRRPRVR